MTLLVAVGSAKTLWYLTRGSGVVALLLLTASVLLGVASALRWHGRQWPRFAVGDLHRNLTLLSIVFVALHVVTTIADGFAPIGVTDAFVPFLSPYRPIWLGLGTVAFDLLLALVATSLLRARVGPRAWRAVHWLAYVSWPVAVLHSFGTGSDARFGWLEILGFSCVSVVSLAALARVATGGGYALPRLAGAVASLLIPAVIFAWYVGGPGRSGWAARAGTPTTILAPKTAAGRVLTAAVDEPTSFVSTLSGRITTREVAAGEDVSFDLRLLGSPGGAARVILRGWPTRSGVSLAASGASFVPATTRTLYTGTVVGLDGTRVVAMVADSAGQRLTLTFDLSIDNRTGVVAGAVTAVDSGSIGGASGDRE
jgi:sulfoxide reductase heme-binding subunit YedZ